MLLPESLIYATMEDASAGCAQVNIYCAADLRAEIASRFTEIFNEKYEAIKDTIIRYVRAHIEDAENAEAEDVYPFFGAHTEDYGVCFSFDPRKLYYGDFVNANDVLLEALKAIKQQYPSIRYEGYVACCIFDKYGGEACQYEISSEETENEDDIVYDFVGASLAFELKYGSAWDELYYRLDDADENEFKKIIKVFHAYSQWVPPDSIDKLIALSEKVDKNIKESLEKFAEAIRAGEDVEIEEKSEYEGWQPPDGYMEALDMFTMAGEISGNTLNFNEPVSSDEAFGLVIEKAEAGDAEAKFTAGKYFIADHLEEETERAIRWIREAAEAGIEAAKEYMDEHSEMFRPA